MIELTGAVFQHAAAFCGVHVADPRDSRAQHAREKLMDAAERLYAERGFAGVSLREITDAAGQRNKSVVWYHFGDRDELIRAVIARHAGLVDRLRLDMVAELAGKPEVSLRERVACLVLPTVRHLIDLGTPSWYARFLAKALVEPSLRADIRVSDRAPELTRMIRWLVVHTCAEHEHRLAQGAVPASGNEDSWRRIGDRLVTAACGMSAPPC